MVSINHVMNGMARYIDDEILGKVNGYSKWIIGAGSGILLKKGENIFNKLRENDMIKILEIIDNDGNIDIEILHEELKKQAQKSSISFELPLVGKITLNESDVDKMYNYIIGG